MKGKTDVCVAVFAGVLFFLPSCGGENGVTSCAEGETLCEGVCVDTQTDARHCGGCNNRCPDGSQCRDGTCTTPCIPTQEVCDGVDNDCDTLVDENLTRDCSNPCGPGEETCTDGVWGNCTAPEGETEICDGRDNDCDGQVDEDVKNKYYRDNDNDGYGDPASMQEGCTAPAGYVEDNTDCNDNDATVRPGNPELCNGKDDNCDGTIDEGCTCSAGETQRCGTDVGVCEFGTQTCQADGTWGDCEGGVQPTEETCDGRDEDCNGQVDDNLPEDDYEINDDCSQVRELPRADENAGRQTVRDATLYSSDGSDDVDWYKVEANEAVHLVECFGNPLGRQCYFYFNIDFTPPSGADYSNYQLCIYTGDCGSFDFEYCTDPTVDWTGSKYSLGLYWEGTCGLDDGWIFYIKVSGSAGEGNCNPYTLNYELIFDGGIGDSYCIYD